MAAHDHLSSQQFYHGTTARLEPGDWITSARNRGVDSPHAVEEGQRHEYNHFGTDPEHVERYATTFGSWDKPGYVYTVQPAGPSERDPEHEHQRTQGYRSKGPLLVTGLYKTYPPQKDQYPPGPDSYELTDE